MKALTYKDAIQLVTRRLEDGKGRAVRSATNDCCTYYRDADGNRCAIGALLTKRQALTARAHMLSAVGVLKRFPERFRFATDVLAEQFMVDLMRLHDTEENWKGNRFVAVNSLARVAARVGL